ncbi:hypothetical protein P168DRAFT_133477 [Aspergillus campestris IBT 28561]|uniref:Uncharacterized protein n=1 Tax=Aspergillus campestris (strain IBT 28561) TaxID=1392248 RepID=A0A2I1D807_ASPC2|nr:uncharacterized protein P168DRAFT_133477 [Aspergillus campestris IBT 28561]PKY06016.1 hypothetical protein P168DRAFT_133477 [Aspergillus campestris IBT 28561]
MKTNFLIILAAVAVGVFANSEANPEASVEANAEATIEADLDFEASSPGDGLVKRAACHKPSKCSVLWAGGCERYCLPHKFSHMTSSGCPMLAKRCCCK